MHVGGQTPDITIYLAQVKAECPIVLIRKARKKKGKRKGKKRKKRGEIRLDYISILGS